jgi:hypothetical protein
MFDPESFDPQNSLILPSPGAGDPTTDPDWAEIERQRRGLLRTAKLLEMQSAATGDPSLLEEEQKVLDAESALPRKVDPRTPIQKLLERFDLEEDQAARAEAQDWNDKELPENKHRKETLEHSADQIAYDIRTGKTPDEKLDYDRDREHRLRDMAEPIDATKRELAVDTDVDVHISTSAIPFPRWHLDAEALRRVTFYKEGDKGVDAATKGATKKDATPRKAVSLAPADEYRTALPYPKPGATLEEIEANGISTEDPAARIVECIRLARSMIPEVPVKGKGSKGVAPAGTLGHVSYGARGTEGWMYVEDPDGEYGTWFRKFVVGEYTYRKRLFEEISAEEGTTFDARMTARYNMRQAAACVAVAYQEGAPSAINTYDGLVLSWGIGIAAPGKLPKTFHEITKDPRVYKAFYLCGFHYDGFVMGEEHHGAYQIVDLESDPPGIVYKDQYNHAPGAKPYDFQGHAYKVLKYFTLQPKLIHLLIQLAKDPLTRATILAPNYRMIQGFVAFGGGQHIETDALHIFAAMVKQNWGFGHEIVLWAVQRFSDSERAQFGGAESKTTSVEKDKAIAKGIVRFLMGRLQIQRWERAIKTMKLEAEGKITEIKAGAKGKLLWRLPAATEFGFTRLLENYWKPLKKGPSAQTTRLEITGPGLAVEDFPEVASSRSDTNYIWIQSQDKPGKPASEANESKYYDLGPLHQFDLLFPHEEIRLIGFEGDSVVIEDRGKRRTVPQNLEPRRWGVK